MSDWRRWPPPRTAFAWPRSTCRPAGRDVLGAAQSGRNSSLRLLSVLDDVEVIASARQAATDLLAADPGLAESPDLAAAVVRLAAAGEFLEKS